MTAGAATFRAGVVILIGVLVLFAIKEVIFHFYPLLENTSPDAKWWNPFIDLKIAQIIYPEEGWFDATSMYFMFWGFTIGAVIALVRELIDIAAETN